MSYRIVFDRPADKGFRRLPEELQQALAHRISALADNPRPPQSRKLEGAPGCYRIRQGDYRIIYTILDDLVVVVVLRVGHRGDVYRGLGELTAAIKKHRKQMGG